MPSAAASLVALLRAHLAEATRQATHQISDTVRDLDGQIGSLIGESSDASQRAKTAGEGARQISGIITQNIDGLHQAAGTRDVVELHGSLVGVVCLTCEAREDRRTLDARMAAQNPGFDVDSDEIRPDGDVRLETVDVERFVAPQCERCGTDMLKPDVVFFGGAVAKPLVQHCFDLVDAALAGGVEVVDDHRDWGIIAVQGPRSVEVVEALGLPTDLEYMSFTEADWNGRPVIVLRSGYTGEKGFELVPRWDDTPAVWDALVEAMQPYGGLPCGLGARDTLRTEMGYALHGHELTEQITPNQARSGWAVGWGKPAFFGRDALVAEKEAGPARRLYGLKATGRGVPRAGLTVLAGPGGETVGETTSGTFSPTLKQGIALALLDRSVADGDEVVIDVRGREVAATVTKPPFVEVQVRQA